MKYFLYLCTRIQENIAMTSTFIGNIEARLDDKGRIFVPAVYRKILADEPSKRIVMRRDTDIIPLKSSLC